MPFELYFTWSARGSGREVCWGEVLSARDRDEAIKIALAEIHKQLAQTYTKPDGLNQPDEWAVRLEVRPCLRSRI